jgi:nicotinamidase-related amidase
MTDLPPLMIGKTALIVVDIQAGVDMTVEEVGIALMEGGAERVSKAERLVAAARAAGLPIVFFQEVHRPSGIDFGRELDGAESRHCVEGEPATALYPTLLPNLADDAREFHIVKRRYSGFIGTEFEIVLRGLKAETLILIGGLTDVCVHYTFADAHQRDFHVRVVEDCVGGSSLPAHDASLNAMEYLQTGARRTTDEVEAAFLALAGATTGTSVPEDLSSLTAGVSA